MELLILLKYINYKSITVVFTHNIYYIYIFLNMFSTFLALVLLRNSKKEGNGPIENSVQNEI